jgi:hypothetical protein
MKYIYFLLFLCITKYTNAQENKQQKKTTKSNSVGVQSNTYLIEHPLFFNRGISFNYSRSLVSRGKHHLELTPQLGYLNIPNIERKYMLGTLLQYKFIPKKRFYLQGNLGFNYILSALRYDRFEYENAQWVNKGNKLHHLGPTAGLGLGYKLFSKSKHAILPSIGFTTTQFDIDYNKNLFKNYKPSLNIGLNITLNN